MPTQADYAATYRNMHDGQLLQRANEDGLVDEAKQALAEELSRRNLKPSDLADYKLTPAELLLDEVRPKGYRGTGVFLYGRGYLNASDKQQNIHLRTKFVAFAFFPLFPIASYRFQYTRTANRWRPWRNRQQVLEKVPVNWRQVIATWIKAILFLAAAIAITVFSILHRHPR